MAPPSNMLRKYETPLALSDGARSATGIQECIMQAARCLCISDQTDMLGAARKCVEKRSSQLWIHRSPKRASLDGRWRSRRAGSRLPRPSPCTRNSRDSAGWDSRLCNPVAWGWRRFDFGYLRADCDRAHAQFQLRLGSPSAWPYRPALPWAQHHPRGTPRRHRTSQ
jgi:hypothetical protein